MIEAATGPHKFTTMGKMLQWVDQVLTPDARRYCPGATWAPSINLYEDDGEYCLVADLAGVVVSEVELSVEGSSLTLAGQRRAPEPPSPDGLLRLHLMEIDDGRFCRAVELPADVIVEEIQASYRCGFLWVRMPKKV